MLGGGNSNSELLSPWQRLVPGFDYLHSRAFGMGLDEPACVEEPAAVNRLKGVPFGHSQDFYRVTRVTLGEGESRGYIGGVELDHDCVEEGFNGCSSLNIIMNRIAITRA